MIFLKCFSKTYYLYPFKGLSTWKIEKISYLDHNIGNIKKMKIFDLAKTLYVQESNEKLFP